MNKDFYQLYKNVKTNWCTGCDSGECRSCYVKDILKQIEELDASQNNSTENTEGCFVCQDKKGKTKEVFYLTDRGGIKTTQYCPECGRKISTI